MGNTDYNWRTPFRSRDYQSQIDISGKNENVIFDSNIEKLFEGITLTRNAPLPGR